jgi:hypothetical protein
MMGPSSKNIYTQLDNGLDNNGKEKFSTSNIQSNLIYSENQESFTGVNNRNISSNTCNKTSNNKYFDCPALMSDGRAFTDYRQSSQVDNMIQYSNNIMSSYQYRQFLINNADKIMDVNTMYATNKLSCNNCDTKTIPFNTVCDVTTQSSKCHTVNPNGIGIYYKTN